MRPSPNMKRIRLGIAAPNGEFLAEYSDKGLAQLHFPTARNTQPQAVSDPATAATRSWHRATKSALKAILAGRAPRTFPPLDLSAGTPFQQTVWHALREIPLGQTRSYGEIASVIGNPKGVRAVGGACGANPIPVLVPCHRVLAAKGKLGGFSGGLDWKQTLLEREGVSLH